MRAIKPTVINKFLFIALFNVFMGLINKTFISIDISWKMFAAVNFIAIIIVLNWLPKSNSEMNSNEKNEYVKIGNFLFTFSSINICSVFIIHLLWLQEMTIIEFMIFSGLPTLMALSFKSMMFKRTAFQK